MGLTDTHAHLDMFGDDAQVQAIVSRAVEAGVDRIVTIGDGLESSRRSVEIANTHDKVYAAVGVHPHDAASLNDRTLEALRGLAAEPKVVAIGETGLDFYRMRSPKEAQFLALERQLELALQLGLTLIVHCRDAYTELLSFMREAGALPERLVVHCFSGSIDDVRAFVELGAFISFAGTVTFKNAERLREVAAYVPADRLLIETDCPYLAPHPHRGRENEPSFLPLIAQVVADVRRLSVEQAVMQTTANADKVFRFGYRQALSG